MEGVLAALQTREFTFRVAKCSGVSTYHLSKVAKLSLVENIPRTCVNISSENVCHWVFETGINYRAMCLPVADQ